MPQSHKTYITFPFRNYEMNKVFLFAGRSDILATSWLFWKCCRGICFWRKLRNVEWKFDWKTKLLQLFQICVGQQQGKVSRIVCPNNTCCWFLFVAAMNYEQQQQRNIIKGIVRTKIDVFFIQLLFLFHEWTIFLTLYWIRPAWHCVLDWAHFFQMKPFNIHGQTSVSL
jgi:hypothetical protein